MASARTIARDLNETGQVQRLRLADATHKSGKSNRSVYGQTMADCVNPAYDA